jgi:hypothetical protein
MDKKKMRPQKEKEGKVRWEKGEKGRIAKKKGRWCQVMKVTLGLFLASQSD